ncbi:MAG: SpoIID/LytB domain-containing protein [Candidatus Hydrogenedentes bacterium]|nr:SpoIID/LytB domain-containing protein [Candidatus Hydrogenedentota bacterium]
MSRVSFDARWTGLALLICGAAWVGTGCAHRADVDDVRPPQPATAPAPAPAAPPPPKAPPTPSLPPEQFPVRLQYVQTTDFQDVTANRELVVTAPGLGLKRLPPGNWRVSAKQTAPPQFTYPVYVKAYEHNETGALQEAMRTWQAQGYTPFVTTMGRVIEGTGGSRHDNRLYWLALKKFPTREEAEKLKTRLHRDKTWAWVKEEVTRPAEAVVTVSSSLGQAVVQARAPVVFRTEGSFALPEARRGQAPVEVPGPLDISIDQTGHMAICGELPLEEYLRGILPAEMYPSWPIEALKAQAVAARSEIIVHARGKHYFDGYDFCIEQHCRAFGGRAGHEASTDRAVAETTGMVIVNPDNSIVPTVFSANCGGYTESNENVWEGGPEEALRGRFDGAEKVEAPGDVARWIARSPDAYCARDTANFRWTREIPVAKISAQFNNEHGIGKLKSIDVLERGVSGRVKSLRVTGDRKSVVIQKELNIRRAFENLPSALCTFTIQNGVVQIKGAGFGHGVGLCQHGAHGMALDKYPYDAILRHYFTGVALVHL